MHVWMQHLGGRHIIFTLQLLVTQWISLVLCVIPASMALGIKYVGGRWGVLQGGVCCRVGCAPGWVRGVLQGGVCQCGVCQCGV